MSFHRLDLVCRGVESLAGLKGLAGENFVVINLQGNSISDLDGFGTHTYLTHLDLKGNRITSLYGLTRQRSLQTVNLKGNPIATHPLYRVMVLMVVGYSVVAVDGVSVTPEERTLARRAGGDAAMAVSFGWLLDLKPRHPDAFRSIIAECKYVHSKKVARRSSGGTPRTVVDALRELEDPTTTAAASTRAVEDQLRLSAQQEAESRRTIERLSKRVATLEQMLQEASAGTAAAETALLIGQRYQDRLLMDYVGKGPGDSATSLSEQELQDASGIVFASGVSTRTNQGRSDRPPIRSCLQLSRRAVSVLNFMTRAPTFELKLSHSVVVSYRRPRTLEIENRFGVTLEITFEEYDVLRTVFKLLFLLRSKPVPPLPPYYDDVDEGWEEQQRLVAERNEHMDTESEDEVEGGGGGGGQVALPMHQQRRPSTRVSSSNASAPSSVIPSAKLNTTAPPQPPAPVTASPSPPSPPSAPDTPPPASVVEEDYIPDVPPLPSPGGSSVVFDIKHATPAAAPAVGASANTTEIAFEVEGDSLKSAQPVIPPRAPPSGRFKMFQLSSSDSDTEGAGDGGSAPAAVPSVPPRYGSTPTAMPSSGPSFSRPPLPPSRADSRLSAAGSRVRTPRESTAPPPAPPSRQSSRSNRQSNASARTDGPVTHAVPPSAATPAVPHLSPIGAPSTNDGSSLSFQVEDTPAAAAASLPAEEPLVSTPTPPAAEPAAAPAAPVSRFAQFAIDSDSDSSAE